MVGHPDRGLGARGGDEAEMAFGAEAELEGHLVEVEVLDAARHPLEEGLHLHADRLPLRRHILLAALNEIPDLSVVLLRPRRRPAQPCATPDEHDEVRPVLLCHAPPPSPPLSSWSCHTCSSWVSMWTRPSVPLYTLRTPTN